MSIKASVCFSAVCLILIAQVSSAFEIKPCDGFKGKLHSFEVHNCPNKTAEYCEIKLSDGIHWDVKYTAGVSYEEAWTGFQYDSLLSEYNHCEAQPGFCPGKAGQEQSYHFDFEISKDQPSIGRILPLQLFTQAKGFDSPTDDAIVCAEFPAKFVNA